MDYRELLRRKVMSDILSKLSEEEKEKLYSLVLNGKGQQEVISLLKAQQNDLNAIKKGQSWFLDLSSNLVGNAIWDSLLYIGSKILKR